MRHAICVLCFALALPLAGAAAAQSVAQPDSMKDDLHAFHGDKDTLVRVLGDFEKATGGRVVDVRFSDMHGHPGYHAVVARQGRVDFFHVSARSHHVVEIDSASGPAWMLGWRGRSDLAAAKHASVPLAAAIRTAEQSQNGAPAVAAGIARSASNPTSDVHAYTVLLDVEGAVRSVSVDSSTGEIIADPGALGY